MLGTPRPLISAAPAAMPHGNLLAHEGHRAESIAGFRAAGGQDAVGHCQGVDVSREPILCCFLISLPRALRPDGPVACPESQQSISWICLLLRSDCGVCIPEHEGFGRCSEHVG